MNATPLDFKRLNEKYGGENMNYIFGPTSLGFPEDVDSNRLYMLSSNQKQILQQESPDVPHVLTGNENIFGRLSDGYKKIDGNWKVVDKIRKFGEDSNAIFILVLYNEDTDTYDMVEKRVAENLTEKFGTVYNTRVMDNMEVGETYKDPILYKSTAYDDHMNYCLGKNANVAYTTSSSNIEDAIKIRRGFAESVHVYEVDSVQLSINDNDILLFMQGNEETGYKTFPDIGEKTTTEILCATRRINKNHILYDFQEENLHEITSTDCKYMVPKNSIVYDINVYYNNTDKEFPDNVFYKQLKTYYEYNCKYADNIVEWCNKILDSGSKFTSHVTYFKSKYMRFNDPEYKWKNKDRVFSNLVVEFNIITIMSLSEGFKLVGRYGDKGVISEIKENAAYEATLGEDDKKCGEDLLEKFSKILGIDLEDGRNVEITDDESMYYTKGEFPIRTDIEVNASGAIRRINTGQLFEVEINFCSERMRQHITKLTDPNEKLDLIFEYISMLNEDECKAFVLMANGSSRVACNGTDREIVEYDTKFRDAFIASVEKDGFYIIKQPHSKIRYEKMEALYKRWPDIFKPYEVYIDIFGMKGKKVMRPMIIGSKYMYVLKQTSRKNFSARSTGRITKAGLPAKSTDKKDNLQVTSNSPIQIGETHNLFSQISGTTMAIYNTFTRTSPKARKSLGNCLAASGNPLEVRKLKVENTYVNANVQILQARFKVMGIYLNFVTNKSLTTERLMQMKSFLTVYGYTFFDYNYNRPFYVWIIDKYNSLVRAGHPRSTEETWNLVTSSDEFSIVKPTNEMVELVKIAIYSRELRTGLIELPKSEDETNEENNTETTDNGECNTGAETAQEVANVV